jgi:Protein of unknown function (DUF2867)
LTWISQQARLFEKSGSHRCLVQLLELLNRTAHAAALSALAETGNGYRFYFGVYVRNVGRFTPIYMALIDPFRKLVVYPSLLRTVRAKWNKTFGTA